MLEREEIRDGPTDIQGNDMDHLYFPVIARPFFMGFVFSFYQRTVAYHAAVGNRGSPYPKKHDDCSFGFCNINGPWKTATRIVGKREPA